MTAIVAVGFKTEAFVSGGGPIPAFSHECGRGDYDGLVDTIRSGLEHTGHVVAILPRYAEDPALARLETWRRARRSAPRCPLWARSLSSAPCP